MTRRFADTDIAVMTQRTVCRINALVSEHRRLICCRRMTH